LNGVIAVNPVALTTLYVIVKSVPVTGVAGGDPNGNTAEWTTPGPSPAPGLQPVPAPLIQFVSSSSWMVKLAVRVFGVIVKLVGLRIVGSVLTWMSQALNGSIPDTRTWKVIVEPAARLGELPGFT